MMGSFDERAALEARSATYELISGLFLNEVTIGFLERLRDDRSFLDGPMGDYAASLRSADLAQARVDAVADFSALFLGMSAHPVAPYESVYTSDVPLLMQDARDEVIGLYREHGFVCSGGFALPEDHVGVELQFMARLCRMEQEALALGDEPSALRARDAQAAFLRDHVLRWVPRMCEDVAKRARTGLYRSLASMTERFLGYEREALLGDAR